MKRKTHLSSFTFLLSMVIFLLLVSSCGSKKKLVSPMAHAANYEWMTAKMNGELSVTSQSTPFSFTGQLRMRHDSTIWVSASVMGVEAVRARVTNDSVLMVNRFEKTYLAEPLETLGTSSLQDFQSLLLNGVSDTVVIPWGPYTARIRYSDIQWDIPTTFPIKINNHYERMKL